MDSFSCSLENIFRRIKRINE